MSGFSLRLAPILKGHLYGLTISAAGSTATFGVAAGEATDSTGVSLMALASAYTKTTSAWAVGSGNGAMDTSSIAVSTSYHVHLIQRPDTGVVDVLFSLSATAPTMPANYTLFRRVGSMLTDGSAQWRKFIQTGDLFRWDSPIVEVSLANPGTSAVTQTLAGIPSGVRVQADLTVGAAVTSDSGPGAIYVSDLSVADVVPAQTSSCTFMVYNSGAPTTFAVQGLASVMTNTSAQIRYRLQISAASITLDIGTIGWTDTRGRAF